MRLRLRTLLALLVPILISFQGPTPVAATPIRTGTPPQLATVLLEQFRSNGETELGATRYESVKVRAKQGAERLAGEGLVPHRKQVVHTKLLEDNLWIHGATRTVPLVMV